LNFKGLDDGVGGGGDGDVVILLRRNKFKIHDQFGGHVT
jgi:hypothetical protein